MTKTIDIPKCCVCGQSPRGKKQPDGGYAPYEPRPMKDGTARAPRGWKRAEGGMRCGTCTAANFMTRSVRLRILGSQTEEWTECRKHLAAASKQVANFANWYLQRLLAADLAAQPYEGKFPPAPEVDYYRDAVRLFPAIAPRGLCTAAQMVKSYYVKRRFEVLGKCDRNVDTYKWDGLPTPVPAQAWKLVSVEKETLLRIQGAPGKSWLLRVSASGEDLARVRALASGEAEAGAAFFLRRARKPLPGEPKGAQRKRSWFLRISLRVPRPTKKRGKGAALKVLTLGHDKESLLFGATDDESDEPIEIPGLDLQSLVAGHIKADRKRQVDAAIVYRQMPARKRRRWKARRAEACRRHNAKVDYLLHCYAAALAEQCERSGVGEVNYDTTPRGFVERLPYFKLKTYIGVALEARGIALHCAGDAPEEEATEEADSHCQAEERHG